MRVGWSVGIAMMGVAMLLWMPLVADPLHLGVMMGVALVGASLAATHWPTVGLGLMAPVWLLAAFQYTELDKLIAVGIAIGMFVAARGAQVRSTPLLVGGLMGAGIVQSYWPIAYVGSPYFWGNLFFTAGALLAATAAWRAGPLLVAAPAPEPETVK